MFTELGSTPVNKKLLVKESKMGNVNDSLVSQDSINHLNVFNKTMNGKEVVFLQMAFSKFTQLKKNNNGTHKNASKIVK